MAFTNFIIIGRKILARRTLLTLSTTFMVKLIRILSVLDRTLNQNPRRKALFLIFANSVPQNSIPKGESNLPKPHWSLSKQFSVKKQKALWKILIRIQNQILLIKKEKSIGEPRIVEEFDFERSSSRTINTCVVHCCCQNLQLHLIFS